MLYGCPYWYGCMSLSARRAWIEIEKAMYIRRARYVALRKESVDRNVEEFLNAGSLDRSLSARRAWIEIIFAANSSRAPPVALRKESVDRNALGVLAIQVLHGRSPQGERG